MKNIEKGEIEFMGKWYKESRFTRIIIESGLHDKYKRALLDHAQYLKQKEKEVIIETLPFVQKQESKTV